MNAMLLARAFRAALSFAAMLPIVARAESMAEQDARFAKLPAGVPLIAPTGIAGFKQQGTDYGSSEMVPVNGQPFAEARRIRTAKLPQEAYQFQLAGNAIAPVTKGDQVLVILYARGVERPLPQDEATAELHFGSGPGTQRSLRYRVKVGAEWEKFYIPFTVQSDGPGQFTLRCAYSLQVIEIGGVQAFDYGTALKLDELPFTPDNYNGRQLAAAWRAAAAERIERLRKGDLTVQVTRGGQPVSGAEVSVRMKRHAFAFGSAIDSKMLLAQGADADRYRATILENFNKVTPDNHLKWWSWAKDRETGPAAVRWLREHDIAVRAHAMVWPAWKYFPTRKKPDDISAEALGKMVLDHIADVGGALRGQVAEWDVVNEAFTNVDFQTLLTGVARDSSPDWVERHAPPLVEWFKAARVADPTAKLDINDYSILSSGGYDTVHQDHYFRTIKTLLDAGAPVQGIGMQSHFASPLTPPARMLEILDWFSAHGLPIQGTEFDVDTYDEQLQADFTRDYLTGMFSHPSVIGVISWGFWEGNHWLPGSAFWRKDWTLRPAGQVWKDLVFKAWWTAAEGRSDKDGAYRVRGFLGDYEIAAKHDGITKTTTAKLVKTGATVTIELAP